MKIKIAPLFLTILSALAGSRAAKAADSAVAGVTPSIIHVSLGQSAYTVYENAKFSTLLDGKLETIKLWEQAPNSIFKLKVMRSLGDYFDSIYYEVHLTAGLSVGTGTYNYYFDNILDFKTVTSNTVTETVSFL